MRKFLLCTALLAAFCSCGFAGDRISTDIVVSGRGSAWVNDHLVLGILSFCNSDEKAVRNLVASRIIYNRLLQDCGYCQFYYADDGLDIRFEDLNEEWIKASIDSIEMKFFDNLTSMLMALHAGTVNAIFVHAPVADYLCERDTELAYLCKFVPTGDNVHIRRLVENGFHSDEFTFMLKKGSESLRDELNAAINAMDNDGTLATLAAHIKTLTPVKIAEISGADTIRVGVTGDLPPFDYVSESGVPAGYNTAVLAEIGKRIGKNIELVNIDAGGRAAALSSGKVDVVFWNRSQAVYTENGYVSGEEAIRREIMALGMDAAKTQKALNLIQNVLMFDESVRMDQPEGTIITRPYYSAVMNYVYKKTPKP